MGQRNWISACICLAVSAAAFAQKDGRNEGQLAGPVVDSRQAGKTDDGQAADGRILGLIEQLSSADYERREEADSELREIGMPVVDHLGRAYRATDDFEVRLRIQRIAEQVFYWDQVIGRNGFLGISHQQYFPPKEGDPRVPQGSCAFEVRTVIADTAAERAGLRQHDLITAVDGVRLPEGAGASEFANLIRLKRPGTIVVLELYRGIHPLRIHVTLGPRPARYYGNPATPELNQQLETAIQKFPSWWSARFGSLPSPASSDSGTPDNPRFLELPSDYGER